MTKPTIQQATGLSDEDQDLVLQYKKYQVPAYRFLCTYRLGLSSPVGSTQESLTPDVDRTGAFAANADVYPGTNDSFRSACNSYFTGDSPSRAIDRVLPRHQWTSRDEEAIIGCECFSLSSGDRGGYRSDLLFRPTSHTINLYKEFVSSANESEGKTEQDGGTGSQEDDDEETQLQRCDIRDLLYRLMSGAPVDKHGQPVDYQLPELRKITKWALNTHISLEAPLLARLALSVSLLI